MPIEYGRFGSPPRKKKPSRVEKPRQEISRVLKYLVFTLNFAFLLVGVTCLSLGVYLCAKDMRAVGEVVDIVLNPAVMLVLVGLTIGIVSLMGSIGALRDNICLLKSFALTVFFCYILLVVATFVLFILFYSDTTEGMSAHSVLLLSIKRYHQNKNLADFIDYVQEQLECCGATSASQGYKDWELSEQYNCSTYNPYPERCGVPFSCCKRSVISGAAGSLANPLLPAIRSLECWQNAQEKKMRDVEVNIHTRGCLQPLKTAFESHAVHIGALVGGIIIPVCFSVCLANILAKQIDRQQYLLEREARRHERRKRRERHRFRDPFANVQPVPNPLTTTTAGAGAKSTLNKTKSMSSGSLKPLPTSPIEPTAAFLHTETVDETKAALPPATGDGERRRRRTKRPPAPGGGERSSRPAGGGGRERTGRPSRPRPSSASPVVRRRHKPGDERVGNRPRLDKRRKSIAVPLYDEQKTAAAEQSRRTQNWVLQQSDLIGTANPGR